MNPMQSPNVGPGGKDFGGKHLRPYGISSNRDPYRILIRKRMTKRNFEKYLIGGTAQKKINPRRIAENGMKNGEPYIIMTTCYYSTQHDTHIASWSNGEGWIYEIVFMRAGR